MKRKDLLIAGLLALVGWAGMPGLVFADTVEPLGVTVNGVDVSAGAGAGWTKDENDNLVTLTGSGPYVLSGTNTTDDVSFMTKVSNTVVVVILVGKGSTLVIDKAEGAR